MRNIIFLVVILILVGCNNNLKKENQNLRQENELLKNELQLTEQLEKESKETFNVKKETQKLFDKYASIIEETNGAIIGNSEFLFGDLNDDGFDDALVFFILNPAEGGNMIVGNEMAIYLNRGNRMEVVVGYDSEKRFRPIEIENNKIHIIEYDFANGDHPNNPTIEKHKYLILNGNKLTESRVYE